MRHWFLFSYCAPCRQSCPTLMSEFTAADLVALAAQQPHAHKYQTTTGTTTGGVECHTGIIKIATTFFFPPKSCFR